MLKFKSVNRLKSSNDNKTFLYIDGTNLLAGLVEIFGFKKVPSFNSIIKDFKKIYAFDRIYLYASYTPSTH